MQPCRTIGNRGTHFMGLAIEVRQHAGPGCRNRLTLPLCAANRYAPAFGSGVRPAFQPSTNRSRSRSASAPVSRQTILSSWKSRQFRPGSPRTTCNCRTTCAWGGLPVGLLPNLHAPRSKMPCAASSGDAAFFSVAHRGSCASSVIEKSGPDTHSTGEWRDAGPQYNDRVECPESRVSRVIRIDGVLHGRFLRELECKIAGKPIEMNDAGH